MINLLPPEGKALYVREYWTRALSVWGFLLGAVLGASTILFIPSYTLLSGHLQAAGEALATAKAESDVSEKEGIIRSTNLVIDQLGTTKQSMLVSSVIEDITTQASVGVSVDSFTFTYKDEVVVSAQIQGVAVSREVLAQFKRNLEALPYFASVTLPISDLAREKDLPFAITVTLDAKAKKT